MLLKSIVGIHGSTSTGGGGPVTTEARLLEDGIEERITEDGETREIESAAPVGFSPTDIANNAWFSDPLTSGLTFSSGQVVEQIDDESGNGRAFSELTVAKQPILATVNGLVELTFDGIDDALVWQGPAFPISGGWTLAFACRHITRVSTGNTWWAGSAGVGDAENDGLQGRGEGLLPNPAWALRSFTDGVNGTPVNLTLAHGTDVGPPHWVIYRSDGATPNRVITVENDLGGSATAITDADPSPLSIMVMGERLVDTTLVGQNSNMGFYAGMFYQQHVIGQDLADLKSWLTDRITP